MIPRSAMRKRGRPSAALRLTGCVLTLALASPPELAAQEDDEPLRLELRAGGGVRILLGDVLGTDGIRVALESGLPVRLQVITELWRDGFFDSQEGRAEWRATIWFDPLGETYRVEVLDQATALSDSPEDAMEILRSELRSGLLPNREGTYYYLGRAQIETLSLSDIEELRRWLRGELGPAAGGGDVGGSAIGRGIRRLFVRALGLPVVQYQARSAEFDWPD